MTFATTTLENYCDIKGGKRLPKGHSLVTERTRHPYIRARDIQNGKISFDDPFYITEETHEKIKRYTVNANDVCVTIVGANVGSVGKVPYFLDGANLTENTVKLTNFKNSDPRFFHYVLQTSDLQQQMKNASEASAQQKLGLYKIKKLRVPAASHEKQVSIAELIVKYDDLIENNEGRIKILEEMAQRLYTEWFVKFKFPGHEKVKFVDSCTKFGKIPEGWEVKSIGDMVAKVKRKTKIPTSEYLEDGEFPVVDQGNDFIAGFTNDETAIYKEELIVFGDHSRCFKFCNFYFACGADGTQLLLSNDQQKMPQKLFYLTVMNSGLQNFGYSRHFKFLKSLKIVVPDRVTPGKFSNLFNNVFDQMRQLQQQNAALAKMRDLLIPQLVSGKRELK